MEASEGVYLEQKIFKKKKTILPISQVKDATTPEIEIRGNAKLHQPSLPNQRLPVVRNIEIWIKTSYLISYDHTSSEKTKHLWQKCVNHRSLTDPVK